METKSALYIEKSSPTECRISITPTTSASDAFQLLGSLAQHILEAYSQAAYQQITQQDPNAPLKSTTQAALQGIKESLADTLNITITNVLNNFNPLRQSIIDQLEEEAIIELTNKKVEEYYNSLPEEERIDLQQSYEAAKRALENRTKNETN